MLRLSLGVSGVNLYKFLSSRRLVSKSMCVLVSGIESGGDSCIVSSDWIVVGSVLRLDVFYFVWTLSWGRGGRK